MAQDFSSALDSAFMLDSDVNHLSQTIDQKSVSLKLVCFGRMLICYCLFYRKQQMMIQSRELEELQQRIRDAENRLKSRQSVNFGSSSTGRNGEGQTAGKGGSA